MSTDNIHPQNPSPESRRKFLTSAGLIAVGVTGAGILSNSVQTAQAQAQDPPSPPQWPWQYLELETELAAQMGYDGYYTAGCCYGAAKGIIGQMAQTYGYPYNFIPIDMFRYGEGGVTGWGSICGAINGAAAAINLFCGKDDYGKLINNLIAWYSQTALPIYVPPEKTSIVMSISNSPLCHASVSQWCGAAKKGVTSAERKERCARLVSDVCIKTITMLNEHFTDGFTPTHSPAPVVGECMTCHGSTAMNNTLTKMDCNSCHTPHSFTPIENWSGL